MSWHPKRFSGTVYRIITSQIPFLPPNQHCQWNEGNPEAQSCFVLLTWYLHPLSNQQCQSTEGGKLQPCLATFQMTLLCCLEDISTVICRQFVDSYCHMYYKYVLSYYCCRCTQKNAYSKRCFIECHVRQKSSVPDSGFYS